jgi:ABC-type nitrate/sulfonate/bicarbonate transport system substrate-binding protein
MKEYILYAELSNDDDGEWLDELPVQAESLQEAHTQARKWARQEAREHGAKVVDAYARDEQTGEQS